MVTNNRKTFALFLGWFMIHHPWINAVNVLFSGVECVLVCLRGGQPDPANSQHRWIQAEQVRVLDLKSKGLTLPIRLQIGLVADWHMKIWVPLFCLTIGAREIQVRGDIPQPRHLLNFLDDDDQGIGLNRIAGLVLHSNDVEDMTARGKMPARE